MLEFFNEITNTLNKVPDWSVCIIIVLYFIVLNYIYVLLSRKQMFKLHKLPNIEKANDSLLIVKIFRICFIILGLVGFIILIKGISLLMYSIPSFIFLFIYWKSTKTIIKLYDYCITLKYMPDLLNTEDLPLYLMWTIKEDNQKSYYVEHLFFRRNILI